MHLEQDLHCASVSDALLAALDMLDLVAARILTAAQAAGGGLLAIVSPFASLLSVLGLNTSLQAHTMVQRLTYLFSLAGC
jgi:hypothetical protein